jgi:tRNA-Thr(GGU) m(6)t(6)A37 methyltransferase TsaA
MQIAVQAIGFVSGTRADPRDDHWGSSIATITLEPSFGNDALSGLENFSHVEVLFCFHRVAAESIHTGARHPRNNPDWPAVGIFAQRGKNRPNRLGTTICRVVEVAGRVLKVAELDAIEGTPILDIKPVMVEFLPRSRVVQPAWSTELMKDYWRDPA